MSRGRKPLSPVAKVGPEFVTKTPADLAAQDAAAGALDRAALEQAESLIRIGRMQVHDFAQKLHRVACAKEFERVRDSREYKYLPYKDADGNLRRCADLEEFCEVFFGRSYRAVAEDAQNLNLLGEELYERATVLGLTSRNFREIRALPQDDQALVKEALAAKNREVVLEILETAIAKHQKEKRVLEKEIKALQGDLEAQRNVSAKRNQKIDELEAQLHRRQADLPEQIHALQMDCVRANAELINAVQKLRQVRLQTMDLLDGNERDWNDDNVLGAVGVTHLAMLWHGQAWIVEEIQMAEQVFGGSKTELHMQGKNAPDLAPEMIGALKQAGVEEARRVAAAEGTAQTNN